MKECVKEVWIKFGSQSEYSENEEKLFAILDEKLGDSIVKVYDASTKSCKELRSRSFDETHISILTDAFGKDNVKFQERKVKAERNRQCTKPIIRQIIPCNHDMYAVVKDSDGGEYKYKVLLYALCNDGEVYPLFYDDWYGVCLSADALFCADRYELEGGEIYSPEGGKPDEQRYDYYKHYACRKCAKLNYSCQQKSGMDEIRLKMERIAKRLDYQWWRNDFDCIADVYYIPKPHYMRWAKYEKLMQEFKALQKQYERNMENALMKAYKALCR